MCWIHTDHRCALFKPRGLSAFSSILKATGVYCRFLKFYSHWLSHTTGDPQGSEHGLPCLQALGHWDTRQPSSGCLRLLPGLLESKERGLRYELRERGDRLQETCKVNHWEKGKTYYRWVGFPKFKTMSPIISIIWKEFLRKCKYLFIPSFQAELVSVDPADVSVWRANKWASTPMWIFVNVNRAQQLWMTLSIYSM